MMMEKTKYKVIRTLTQILLQIIIWIQNLGCKIKKIFGTLRILEILKTHSSK